MKESEIKSRLRRNGERRKRQRHESEQLQEETARLVEAARKAHIPMTVVAELTDLNRSTLYELYLEDDERGQPEEAAVG